MQPTGIPLPGPLRCLSFVNLKRLLSSFFCWVFFFGFVFVVGMIGGARTLHKACSVLILCRISSPHIKLLPLHLFFQWCTTLMLQLFPQQLEWCLCSQHRRAREERSEGMMHGRLLSDALIFFPRVEILLCSPLPVLRLSGCDKLMAPGATAACWESQQHWRMFS